MSVAFTREDSAETAAEAPLPDRPISPHPNLVTAAGLAALEAALAQARADYARAQEIADANERRRAAAPALRDLTYYSERLASAQLTPAPQGRETVGFGHRVTFARNGGAPQTFALVGEDEADPRRGSISYVAPLARLLMGKPVGESFHLGKDEIEILAIA